jgi:hypothetical protein
MTRRKASHNVTVALATAALLIAATDAATAVRADRGPTTGGTTTTATTKPVQPDFGRGSGCRFGHCPHGTGTSTTSGTHPTPHQRFPGTNHTPDVTLKRGVIGN